MPSREPADRFIGKKFGMFTVLRESNSKKPGRWVIALCECGVEKQVCLAALKFGTSTNCGCKRKKTVARLSYKHGLSNHTLYRVWRGIIERCYYPKHQKFARYGGRGISVCDEWRNDFMSFYIWAIENGWTRGLEVDREENDGNYCEDNCRIVTKKQNRRNTSSNHMIEFNGQRKCVSEWAEIINIKPDTLKDRLGKLGWTIEKSLTTPLITR